MKHRNLTIAFGRPESHLTAPNVRYLSPGCNGTVRTLYVRLLRPQRWIPAGWVCEMCGRSFVVDRATLAQARNVRPATL